MNTKPSTFFLNFRSPKLINVSNFLRFLWRHSNYKMAVFLPALSNIKNFLRYKFANVMLYKLCKRIFLNSRKNHILEIYLYDAPKSLQLSRQFSAQPRVMLIYAKFANFARLYFPYFTTFPDQTVQFY